MADRTSAELFGTLFELLAENPTDEHKAIARRMFDLSGRYDFSEYQMEADEACVTLGLARRGIHAEYPEDGEVVLWPGDDEAAP